MNTTSKVRGSGPAIVFGLVTGIIILIIVGVVRQTPEEKMAEQARLEDLKPIKKYVEIRSDQWSETITPKLEPQKRVSAGAIGLDVPYRVAINGGRENGGIEYDVPAFKDWKRLDWKPPELPNTILEIKFRYLKTGKAQVWCKIEPV